MKTQTKSLNGRKELLAALTQTEMENPKQLDTKPAITPEAIDADKRARCEAAKGEFAQLCAKHRVVFVPMVQFVGNQQTSDFMIVAQ